MRFKGKLILCFISVAIWLSYMATAVAQQQKDSLIPRDSKQAGSTEAIVDRVVKEKSTADEEKLIPFNPAWGTANIKGSVILSGIPPERTRISMASEPVCQSMYETEIYDQNSDVNPNSTLPHVLIYIKRGADTWLFPIPTEPVVLTIKGCRYNPHVFGIQVDQPLQIVNDDPLLHNVHTYPEYQNSAFNVGLPVQGAKIQRRFEKQSSLIVPIKSDIYRWMVAFTSIFTHPFYSVTGSDGTFFLRGLPPGKYELEAWHEKYGIKTQTVVINDKETIEIIFTFQAQ